MLMNKLTKKPVPLVSIVITTKNEEKHIDNCLRSIKAQTYPKDCIEVIVVDNNSTDKTKEIAEKYTKNVFNFGPERSSQRNFGVGKSVGKYLIYLDADMILSPAVIEKSVEMLEKEKCLALYIPEVILGNSYWSQVRRFERSFYDGTAIDCVRMIRSDVFKKLNGFDEFLTGPEDWDLDKRIRNEGKVSLLCRYDFKEIDQRLKKIVGSEKDLFEKLKKITKDPVIFHNETGFNLRKYLSKKKYYAKSFDKYIDKWGKKDEDIKKQFGFKYRYLSIFIENNKWLNLVSFPLNSLGIMFLRFSVGLIYLFEKNKKFWK